MRDYRFGIKDEFQYKTCTSCEHIQLSPLLEEDQLLNYYNTYYNTVEKSNSNQYLRLRSFINSTFIGKIYNWIEGDITFSLTKGNGRLLEIGCNEGKNLQYYSRNGYDTYGLEINRIAASEAEKKGYKIFKIDIKELSKKEYFDIIVIPNVIEHVPNPIQLLTEIKLHLKPQGELWISLPNSNSIFRKIFGKHWINWHPPFHISQFNEQNLCRLLTERGFSINSIKYVTPNQWISMSLISSLFGKPKKPTKEMRSPTLLIILMLIIKIVFLFPMILFNKNKGGDCLKLVAINE